VTSDESGLPIPIAVPGWPRPAGFSNGMQARGRLIVTAGVVGWNVATGVFASDDLVDQTAQALRNIVAVLKAAGAEPHHLVRLTWYLTSRDEYVAARAAIGAQYRAIVGRHFPAMAVIFVSGLLEPRARVEIEATAVVPDSPE